ncbi:hypothetical protein Tco_0333583 [Tanacetum coccineum]
MSTPKFADSHNMVAFLAKPTESDGFEQILDFLNANPIKCALTVNSTIYTSFFLDKQVGDMTIDDEIFVTPSHTKKVFGNMKRVRKGFSRVVTPLFPTMMVQAQEEMGEGSAMPTDPHHKPIIQPSTSQP